MIVEWFQELNTSKTADSELFRKGFSVLGELYMLFILNTVPKMPLAQLHHNTSAVKKKKSAVGRFLFKISAAEDVFSGGQDCFQQQPHGHIMAASRAATGLN